jgi:hypothetical protein
VLPSRPEETTLFQATRDVCNGSLFPPGRLDFEILLSLKTFDRNPQVRFPKGMVAIGLQNSLVYGLRHDQLFNNSWATSHL